MSILERDVRLKQMSSLRSKRFRLVSEQRKTEEQEMECLPPSPLFYILAPFFPRSLTLVPVSLLRNRTETLATQAKRCPSSRIKGVKKGRGQLKVSALQRSSSYRGVRSFWSVFVFATTYMKAVNIDICLRHHATNQPHNKWTRPLPQRHDCQKLYVFIAYMESVKQKCRAIYLLPIADIISFAEKENERQKKRLFPWLNHVINFR